MIIGCCTNTLPRLNNDVSYEYAEQMKKAGFDYIDLPLAQVTALSDGEFKDMVSYLKSVDLPVHACNSFIPGGLSMVGPNQKTQELRDYLSKALERADSLGAKFIGYGSPGAKTCPAGYSMEDAYKELADWCWWLGEEANQYALQIALEPVSSKDTNMIINFGEAVEFAKKLNHPKIKALVDYYQMREENDTVDSLLADGREYLVHTHFATAGKRGFPVSVEEDDYYTTYFRALKQIGYDGSISQEGLPISQETFFEEAQNAVKFLRKCWEEASVE